MLNGWPVLKKIWNLNNLYYWLSAFIVILLSLILFSAYIPYNIKLKPGDIAKQTITSPRYIRFETSEDKLKTEELKKQRALLIEKTYVIDHNINKNVLGDIYNFFTKIKKLKLTNLKNTPRGLSFLSQNQLTFLLNQSNKILSTIEYYTLQSAEKLLLQGVIEIDPNLIQIRIEEDTKLLDLDRETTRLIYRILIHYLKPNKIFDESISKANIEKELKLVTPFTTEYKKGEPIIYKDEQVKLNHIEALIALNIYGVKANFFKILSIIIINFIVFLILELFIYFFYRKIYKKYKYFFLVYLITLILVLLARIIQLIPASEPFQLQFLIPIQISSLILSLLITPNIAMLCGTIICILIGIVYQTDFLLFIYLFSATCISTYATYRKYKRKELIKSGYIVGLINILLILAIGIFKEINDPWWFIYNSLLGFGNGLFSNMLGLAILPYFEDLFKITTQQNLLEHSNLNHPLLKKLLTIAPGTYQHSLMVANLAEAAAEVINADIILARTGAYFHDIGKMKRPYFYTENQFTGDNPHDSLSPRMSKIIISSHPKDGVEIANKYKLPAILKEFILTHHGTSLVSFFYAQALKIENIKDVEVIKEEFRYPGPLPILKETGIVMLADSVEAAVKSLEKPTLTKVENMIEKIVKEKIMDNQLIHCPLSLAEIEKIKSTFFRVLKGMHHSRIDYDEELNSLNQQAKFSQNFDDQQ